MIVARGVVSLASEMLRVLIESNYLLGRVFILFSIRRTIIGSYRIFSTLIVVLAKSPISRVPVVWSPFRRA